MSAAVAFLNDSICLCCCCCDVSWACDDDYDDDCDCDYNGDNYYWYDDCCFDDYCDYCGYYSVAAECCYYYPMKLNLSASSSSVLSTWL